MRVWAWMVGEGAQLYTPPNFSSLSVTKELLDSSKILMIHEPSGENIHKFQYAVQIEIFQENTFFWPTAPLL